MNNNNSDWRANNQLELYILFSFEFVGIRWKQNVEGLQSGGNIIFSPFASLTSIN